MVRFISADREPHDADVVIFGAPYDGTASFRPGTRFGPDAIRLASDGLETYSPALDGDLEGRRIADIGDVDLTFGAAGPQIEKLRECAAAILERGAIPFMLGGEHSLTAGPVEACLKKFGSLTVVQFDAHADLRTDYLGDPDSHACVMNRCVELGAELVQFGIRSGTRNEWARMRDTGTLRSADDVGVVLAGLGTPVYVTLDIDVFDPSLVPGTGTPEPGGVSWKMFESWVSALNRSGCRIVGVDVMEVAPGLDPSGVSAVVAAKCVRELLLLL